MSCPAITVETAGLADLLGALDCRTGEATELAFGRLFGAQGALLPALTILLTLYVALFAIRLVTGRARIGAGAFTPRMLTLGLALTFATSWVAYQNVVWTLATGAPDQVASVIAGTHGSATRAFAIRIDAMFETIADAAQAASVPAEAQPAAGGAVPAAPAAMSGSTLLWISALMLLVGTVGVLVTAKIALAALLAVGPAFVVMALFAGTRGLFEGWLKAAVLFALVPMFAVLIGGGTIALIAPIARAAVLETGTAATRATVALFLAATVYCALMLLVVKVASTIVGGWRLPGSPREDRDSVAGGGAHSPSVAAAAPPAGAAPAGQPATLDSRVRAIVAGLPAAANDGAVVAAAAHPIANRRTAEVGFAAPPPPPPTGVGSRFRALPLAPPRPIQRDRLP